MSAARAADDGWVRGGGAHATGCGHREKLYCAHDRVSSIMDSMTTLAHRSSGTGLRALLFSGDTGNGAAASHETRPGVLCLGCKTTDPRKITIDSHTCRNICECGIEGSIARYGTEYKDLHPTDGGQPRADAPSGQHRDCFSFGLANSLQFQGTTVPKEAKVGHANRVANRVEGGVRGSALSKKLGARLLSVMKEVCNLLLGLSPVEESIARVIRIKTDKVFHDAVTHSELCNHSKCQLDLFSKPTRVIAQKCIVYTVEKLCSGEDSVDGVSKMQLANLHQRITASHVFNMRDNAKQHEACLAMIRWLDTANVCAPCAAAVAGGPVEEPQSSGTEYGSKKRRLNSTLSPDEPSTLIKVRDAIHRLSKQFEYADSVRDKALAALSTPDFARVINSDTVVPDTASRYGKAYVVLRSVHEAMEAVQGGPSGLRDHSDHVARVNMQTLDVDNMVAKVRAVLACDMEIQADGGDDDGSFY